MKKTLSLLALNLLTVICFSQKIASKSYDTSSDTYWFEKSMDDIPDNYHFYLEYKNYYDYFFDTYLYNSNGTWRGRGYDSFSEFKTKFGAKSGIYKYVDWKVFKAVDFMIYYTDSIYQMSIDSATVLSNEAKQAAIDSATALSNSVLDSALAYTDSKVDGITSVDGKIGIGTESPEYLLDVNGTLRAQKIIVESEGNTADYVFADDYKLKDLEEVGTYVKKHKHLEGIPSAEEMETQGVNLAEMNKLLLEKVEELTLYTVKQNNIIISQNQKIDSIQSRLTEINNILNDTTQLVTKRKY